MRRSINTDYVGAFGRWCSVMLLLTLESVGFRHRRSRLAAVLAILEPIGIISIFSISHSLISVMPPFGTSYILFYATGIIPYYLFFHVSLRVRSWDNLQPIPRVTRFDQLTSHVLGEILIKIAVLTLCSAGLLLIGVEQAIPARPADCLLALLTLAGIGVGVGMVSAVIGSFFRAWLYLYAIVMRAWIVFSGVLYVVDWMPLPLREVAVLNPLTHAIIWYRSGQYENYPTHALDLNYLFISMVVVVAFGLLAENSTRQWRSAR